MERQNSQVVWTAPAHRKLTGAPQSGQVAVGPVNFSHPHGSRAQLALNEILKISCGAFPAAEQVQTQRSEFRESVASQMRLPEQAYAGDSARIRKLMPRCSVNRVKIHLVRKPFKEVFELRHIRERAGMAAMRLNDPFDATHFFYCAPPHSGQNLAARGICLPQFMQNFVSPDADGAAPADGVPLCGCTGPLGTPPCGGGGGCGPPPG